MTILSQNLKTIRKNLGHTQMAVANELDIGFRTYVRYEAGERDAPVSIMIKLAKLGNMSLDRLLTTEVKKQDLKIKDTDSVPKTSKKMEVIGGSLDEGRLVFKGLKSDFLVSSNSEEKKLLTKFRKMDKGKRDRFLKDIEWTLGNNRSANPGGTKKKVSKNTIKAKNTARLKKMTKAIKKITVKG
jgi:transcriptional regulator with XRE-family HTH domain